MERFLVIIIGAIIGVAFFIWFSKMIKKDSMKQFIMNNLWLLHPNSICYWRVSMAIIGFFMYFFTDHETIKSIAIIIFTFAAILDGVDGVVARGCDLGTTWGEWLDPVCDKLTYLPPLLGFAYTGLLDVTLVWILVAIEFFGQFLARHVLKLFKTSGAANNFGKIKAIMCFALVIFCALIEQNPWIIDLSNEVLNACIILAAASIIFKFIPNKLYADILSTLNFCCGVTSLILTYNDKLAWAICVIIVGQMFDLFDGRMAEKHGGTKYGPYLDDIADFVSFGLAPAYMVVQAGGFLSWLVAAIYIGGVAWRLIRFVVFDKNRTDLPEGVFNGLPSPAGALIVLGAALICPANLLSAVAIGSTAIMVSHIRFAHFGRVIMKQIPKPLFFIVNSAIIVTLAYVLKTKNADVFGYLILSSVALYMVVGRWLIPTPETASPAESE